MEAIRSSRIANGSVLLTPNDNRQLQDFLQELLTKAGSTGSKQSRARIAEAIGVSERFISEKVVGEGRIEQATLNRLLAHLDSDLNVRQVLVNLGIIDA